MKIKIRDIPTFYKILFPSIAITLMVTLTSTIFTYNKASEIISSVVNRHESKRTTRDLVFEEEDDQDVNTKTQTSSDNEPFVATYELIHN